MRSVKMGSKMSSAGSTQLKGPRKVGTTRNLAGSASVGVYGIPKSDFGDIDDIIEVLLSINEVNNSGETQEVHLVNNRGAAYAGAKEYLLTPFLQM